MQQKYIKNIHYKFIYTHDRQRDSVTQTPKVVFDFPWGRGFQINRLQAGENDPFLEIYILSMKRGEFFLHFKLHFKFLGSIEKPMS